MIKMTNGKDREMGSIKTHLLYIRDAVDKMSEKIDKIDIRSDKQENKLSEIEGKVNGHKGEHRVMYTAIGIFLTVLAIILNYLAR